MDYASEPESQSAILVEAVTQTGRRGRPQHGVPKWMPGEIDKVLEKDLTAKIGDMEDKHQAFYVQQQEGSCGASWTRRRRTGFGHEVSFGRGVVRTLGGLLCLRKRPVN